MLPNVCMLTSAFLQVASYVYDHLVPLYCHSCWRFFRQVGVFPGYWCYVDMSLADQVVRVGTSSRTLPADPFLVWSLIRSSSFPDDVNSSCAYVVLPSPLLRPPSVPLVLFVVSASPLRGGCACVLVMLYYLRVPSPFVPETLVFGQA